MWDETLIPKLKDIVAWGLENLQLSDPIENFLESTGDLTALALGSL